MTIANHLFIGETGDLFDTRRDSWHIRPPLRRCYSLTYREIRTAAQLKATLRAGPYAWPGGYPMFFLTCDGAVLSFDTVREELRNVLDSVKEGNADGWCVSHVDINYEDNELFDDHSGELIPSAY